MATHGGHHKDTCDAGAHDGAGDTQASVAGAIVARPAKSRRKGEAKPTSTPSNVATHWWIFVLIACNYTQLDLELILSYFFLGTPRARAPPPHCGRAAPHTSVLAHRRRPKLTLCAVLIFDRVHLQPSRTPAVRT